MSTQIQFLDTVKSGCKAPVAAVFFQAPAVTFNTANDGTTATTITTVATGSPAYYGGTFINKGCEALTVEITQITGGDCDACNDPDVLTTSTISWTIEPNSVKAIPDVFWSSISYTLANAANDNKTQTVSFETCYSPDCPDCLVLVP